MKIEKYLQYLVGACGFLMAVSLPAGDYTVTKGDCLWFIASKYYNNPFVWTKIYDANKDKINNPDLIFPDQVFVLPDLDLSKKDATALLEQKESTTMPQEQEQTEITEVTPEEVETSEVKSVEPSVSSEELPGVESVTENSSGEQLEAAETAVESVSVPLEYEETTPQVTPTHKQKFFLNEQEADATFTGGKDEKMMYSDGDVMYCKLSKDIAIKPGEMMYIYHIGADVSSDESDNSKSIQANYVGRLRILEIKGKDFSGVIVRTNFPVNTNDILIK